MVAYPYKMPSGIPGAVTRVEWAIIEAILLDQTTPPTEYGVAVKLTGASKATPIGAGDVATAVYGVLVRPYPTSGNGTDGLGTSTPNKALPADVMKAGYINVLCNNFAVNPPSKGSPVYVRIGGAATNKVVGRFEAAPDIGATATGPVGTGNGTIGSLSASQNAAAATPAGVYTLKATDATHFNLIDSTGAILGNFATGSLQTASNGLKFQITVGGTPFVAGDTFTVTVAANTILIAGTNTYFTGGADSFGNAEIAFKI